MIHVGNNNSYKQVEASVSGLPLGNSRVLFSPPKLDYGQTILSTYHKVNLQNENLSLLKSSKLLANPSFQRSRASSLFKR